MNIMYITTWLIEVFILILKLWAKWLNSMEYRYDIL